MLDVKSLFQKLRDLEAKATPGPWKIELGTLGEEERVYGIYSGKYSFDKIIETDTGFYPPRRPDADLIVEYRNAIPKLLEALDVMQEVLEMYAKRDAVGAHEPWSAQEALTEARELAGED